MLLLVLFLLVERYVLRVHAMSNLREFSDCADDATSTTHEARQSA